MDASTLADRKVRVRKLIRKLKTVFPDAKLALRHRTHWQLMVAVQLSAQSTDKKVNEIVPELFKRYKTVQDFAEADLPALQEAISSVLYYKNKGKNIKAAAQKVVADFRGRLPRTMEEMLTLPGVARKTANVVLGTLFQVYDGIVVDTHMIRFARRFALSDFKDAVRIERDLMAIVPKKDWYQFSYLVVDYGRLYGNPRGKSVLHQQDPLLRLYPPAKNYWPSS
ncbi:MAG: endonuclease III [Candidatus Kaiserbacteria bacterium]|nr:endonuclease III [Candidatus Kaiserbacteria bacterium]